MSERTIFEQGGACLHCMVWDTINAHSPDWPDGSGKQYHAEYIIGNLTDVMAELIAAFPRPDRRQFIRCVEDRLKEQIAKHIADGDTLALKAVNRQ